MDLIDELLKDSVADLNISALLRKARVLASELKIDDFESWISYELNGYENNVPQYRKIRGELKFHNPVRGWCPILFPDTESDKICSTLPIGQKIAEIESLCGSKGTLGVKISPEQRAMLLTDDMDRYEVKLFVDRAALHGIIDSVKNTLQEWVLNFLVFSKLLLKRKAEVR